MKTNMITQIKHQAPLGKSHHQVLQFDFKCYTKEDQSTEEQYSYHKGDYQGLQSLMNEHNWEDELRDLSAVEAWNSLERSLNKHVDDMIK